MYTHNNEANSLPLVSVRMNDELLFPASSLSLVADSFLQGTAENATFSSPSTDTLTCQL